MTSFDFDARPDKHWVRKSFGAAAQTYDGVADLQRAVGDHLLRRLSGPKIPSRILDVGSGTGYLGRCLKRRWPRSDLVCLDIAEGMLRAARERMGRGKVSLTVCGDAEALPLADGCCDLVVSNLALQWCPNLDGVFPEFQRVLRPGGGLLFSTFGPETLSELRDAWAAVDRYTHVNEFPEQAGVAAVLERTGFENMLLQSEMRCLFYSDVQVLMGELKSLGARNVTVGRSRHLTGRGTLASMAAVYEMQRTERGIPASFEVYYGSARKPLSR